MKNQNQFQLLFSDSSLHYLLVMTEENGFNSFLPEKRKKDDLFVEIPAQQTPPPDRIPSGFDPMGEIELRGRASGRLAGGQVPWWVLISGWIMFGILAFAIVHVAIASSFRAGWFLLAVAAILLVILLRGTTAKLTVKKRRSRR